MSALKLSLILLGPHSPMATPGIPARTHKFDKTSGKVAIDRAANTGSADATIDGVRTSTWANMRPSSATRRR